MQNHNSTMNYTVLINGKSGYVLNNGEDNIRQSILSASLTNSENIFFLAPEELNQKLDSYNDKMGMNLLIGGGDGTIRSCAGRLLDKKIPFGILPMGTMNLLAQDLHIPVVLDEAIAAYKSNTPEQISIDVGVANDECFLCCAGFGIMPEASSYREKLRENNDFTIYPKLTAFILERMDIKRLKRIYLETPTHSLRLKTASLVISNNRFSDTAALGENQFKKDSLQDSELGLYALQSKNWFDTIRFLMKLGLSGWKKDPVMSEWVSRKATVRTADKIELVSLDGEPFEMNTPVEFSVRPLALELLVPGSLTSKMAA